MVRGGGNLVVLAHNRRRDREFSASLRKAIFLAEEGLGEAGLSPVSEFQKPPAELTCDEYSVQTGYSGPGRYF